MQAAETVEVTLGRDTPVHTLELPVPDIPGRRVLVEEDAFGAGAAGVVQGPRVNVAWRAAADGAAVELWPLELAAARMRAHGSKLRIRAPFAALPNCVAVSADDAGIVVDFVTDVGVMYTVALQPEWLLHPGAAALAPTSSFSRVSRPYSFDASPPRLMRAIDTRTLVVALADGTLVRFDRPDALATPAHTVFTEHYSTGLGAGLARVFRAGADRVPGRPELALRAAVAMAALGPAVLTLAIDGSLRLWSLRSNACEQVISPPPHTSLRTRPAALLATHADHVLVAQQSDLQVYKLLPNNTLSAQTALASVVAPELRSWFITGLVLRPNLSAIVAFKTNLSARIYTVSNGHWSQIGGYNLATLLDLPADASIQNVAARVFQSSESVLRRALLQLAPAKPLPAPLSEHVVRDIVAALADGADERTQWFRLDTLCREIEVADAELLAVAATPEAPESLGWTIRASSFTLLSSDLGSELDNADPAAREVLDIATDLTRLVPESVLSKISAHLLSSDMLLDRVDDVCELVRPYLDSTHVNEIGRRHSKHLVAAISRYANLYAPGKPHAPSSATATNAASKSDIELSGLGALAVTELVRNYAIQQSRAFLLLTIVSVIGLVEGWFVDQTNAEDNTEPLRSTLACHQRLAFVAALDTKFLQPGISSAQLSHFGLPAARELTQKIDFLATMASMLPVSEHDENLHVYAQLNTLAGIIKSSVSNSELVTLRGLAALAAHEDQQGEELLRRVSLAHKWPPSLAPVPTNSAAWFARVAQYAEQVGAHESALRFARTGSVLGDEDVLSLLFELSLKAGDISGAYTALVRRCAFSPEIAKDWLSTFIETLARRDPDGAPKLIATLPFIGLTAQLTSVLKEVQVFASIPAYKLRYAWHIEHEDYAGAALSIYEHIKREQSDVIRKNALYTICLNALALQKDDSRWVIYGNRVVTYDEIRNEYTALLEEMTKIASSL